MSDLIDFNELIKAQQSGQTTNKTPDEIYWESKKSQQITVEIVNEKTYSYILREYYTNDKLYWEKYYTNDIPDKFLGYNKDGKTEVVVCFKNGIQDKIIWV